MSKTTGDASCEGRRDGLLRGTRQAFAEACEALAPEHVHDVALQFAGHPVRMQVAGEALAEVLYRCFEPLVDPNPLVKRPALSIKAWDRSQTGIGCPGIACAPDVTDVLGPGLMSQYESGRILRYERAEIVKCIDRARCELFFCVQDARRMRLNDRTKPFPHFLATWYLDRGVLMVHAGAISRKERAILLAGRGGSGKSTSAISCALAGFDFLGDDSVGITLETESTVVYASYNGARCDPNMFPELESLSVAPIDASDKGKCLVYLSDICRESRVLRSSVAAIVVTSVRGRGASQLAPASKPATLRKFAPSTLLRGLGAGPAGFAAIAELTRRVPCYDLQLGATARDVPCLITRLLDDLDR